jgi:hypothetical protein
MLVLTADTANMLCSLLAVFEAADKEVKDKDLRKKDKKEGGDDLGNMLSNLFGGNKKK